MQRLASVCCNDSFAFLGHAASAETTFPYFRSMVFCSRAATGTDVKKYLAERMGQVTRPRAQAYGPLAETARPVVSEHVRPGNVFAGRVITMIATVRLSEPAALDVHKTRLPFSFFAIGPYGRPSTMIRGRELKLLFGVSKSNRWILISGRLPSKLTLNKSTVKRILAVSSGGLS